MANIIRPEVGNWYNGDNFPEIFEVVALDEDNKTIEIQYFDGSIEELEYSLWHASMIEEIPAPEDWSGPYEMVKEDFNDYTDQAIHPESWANPIDSIESDDIDWQENHII